MFYNYKFENISTLSKKLKDYIQSSEYEQVLETLISLNRFLKGRSTHTKEDYISLAGNSGCIIDVLKCKNYPIKCYTEALKALHQLTFSGPENINQARLQHQSIFPSEITNSVQRLIISILKEELSHFQAELFGSEYTYILSSCLGILYNLIVCAPEEVLGSIILNTSHSFAFYKLPGIKEPKIFEDSETLTEDLTASLGNDIPSRVYTNRNRRKRLRRKRAQPTRSIAINEPASRPSLPSERSAFVPRTPPSPQSLSSLSLKPQWIQGSSNFSNVNKDSPQVNFTLEKDFQSLKINISETNNGESVLTNEARFVETSLESRINFPGKKSSFNEYDQEKLSVSEAKVRRSALVTMNAVIDKAGQSNKFGFWPQLLCQNPSLMTCVLKDPSPLVRMSALQVINTFLRDSQQVLSMAVDENCESPYTTLGRQLGSSIRDLHRCLALALLSEKSSSALVRILKTFELLLENVKYSNLKPGLLTKVITHVKYFLRYKEAVVRANAFSVMVSFLMVKPQLPEIKDLLTKYRTPAPRSLAKLPSSHSVSLPCFEESIPGDSDSELNELASEESASSDSCTEEGGEAETMTSWIVQRCLDSLILQKGENVQGIYIQVQLQSLKVLSALVSEHFGLIKNSLPLVQHVILVCCEMKPWDQRSLISTQAEQGPDEPEITYTDPDVVVEHSYLLLGALLSSLKMQLESQPVGEEEEEHGVSSEIVVNMWLWTLQHPLKILLEISGSSSEVSSHQPKLGGQEDVQIHQKAYPQKPLIAAANILSHLCLQVLENIGEPIINQILRTVNFLLTNEDLQLQLSGIRIMAIIVGYPPIVESPLGPKLALATIRVTTTLLSPQYKNVNKDRLLASWAVANVFSSLSMYRETARSIGMKSFVDRETLIRVMRVAMNGCQDKDKIKPHSVRCLGYAIGYLTDDLASQDDIQQCVEDATKTLIECCTTGSNMRMRWNACHALRNLLTNTSLRIEEASWRSSVLLSLSSLIEKFQNYKVRIQACSALCNLKKREAYGPEFALIWKSVLKGLRESQNIPSYKEIQKRDEFIHQMCIGLCQLTCLLQLPDLEEITDYLALYQDILKELLSKTQKSLPPEQASYILKASEKVHFLNESDVLTVVQSQGLCILCDIFNNI